MTERMYILPGRAPKKKSLHQITNDPLLFGFWVVFRTSTGRWQTVSLAWIAGIFVSRAIIHPAIWHMPRRKSCARFMQLLVAVDGTGSVRLQQSAFQRCLQPTNLHIKQKRRAKMLNAVAFFLFLPGEFCFFFIYFFHFSVPRCLSIINVDLAGWRPRLLVFVCRVPPLFHREFFWPLFLVNGPERINYLLLLGDPTICSSRTHIHTFFAWRGWRWCLFYFFLFVFFFLFRRYRGI